MKLEELGTLTQIKKDSAIVMEQLCAQPLSNSSLTLHMQKWASEGLGS